MTWTLPSPRDNNSVVNEKERENKNGERLFFYRSDLFRALIDAQSTSVPSAILLVKDFSQPVLISLRENLACIQSPYILRVCFVYFSRGYRRFSNWNYSASSFTNALNRCYGQRLRKFSSSSLTIPTRSQNVKYFSTGAILHTHSFWPPPPSQSWYHATCRDWACSSALI